MSADSGKSLHVGQLNFPSKEAFRDAFEQIFARRFYANHGPLEHQLDQALAARFDVRHAISVTNATIALMLTLKAVLSEGGEVITPAFTFPATAQSLLWAGLTPVFCDVDPHTHMPRPEQIEALIGPRTVGVLAVHLWGRACDPAALQALVDRHRLKLVFDAAHATGCSLNGRPLSGFGDAEILSFHATKVLNGAEGGCILTNDDALAERLRVMRSFHASTSEPLGWRMNAKVSEAQAAMALLGLDALDASIAANRLRYEGYQAGLAGIAGVRFIDHAAHQGSNYQYVVADIDAAVYGASRDALVEALHQRRIYARTYFAPGIHRIPPFCDTQWHLPETDRLCTSLIQFPSGQDVTGDDIATVCAVVREMGPR